VQKTAEKQHGMDIDKNGVSAARHCFDQIAGNFKIQIKI